MNGFAVNTHRVAPSQLLFELGRLQLELAPAASNQSYRFYLKRRRDKLRLYLKSASLPDTKLILIYIFYFALCFHFNR